MESRRPVSGFTNLRVIFRALKMERLAAAKAGVNIHSVRHHNN